MKKMKLGLFLKLNTILGYFFHFILGDWIFYVWERGSEYVL